MKQWVVGNWKMNGSLSMVSDYVPALLDGLLELSGWERSLRVGICPPSPYLGMMASKLTGYPVEVGAQNVHPKPSGAFTGEIAPPMLRELGVDLCLVGHSERRQLFGETDEAVREKLSALLEANLTPIVCVGEVLAEREAGRHLAVVERQVQGALEGLPPERLAGVVLAYEPVWAIGTGKTATPEQANQMHAHIRALLAARFGAGPAAGTPILYGGSVTPDNAGALLAQPDINGTLVGGASLKPATFLPIIQHSLS
jgi:triosephosphate isomerase